MALTKREKEMVEGMIYFDNVIISPIINIILHSFKWLNLKMRKTKKN